MTEQSKGFNIADWCERTAWTAVQSFLAIFVITDISTLRTAAVAGAAALLSAVKSLAQERLKG
tara:strand:- start:4962 stop:5150 length:189 start_codon:yes stop_codon:yes gene_type:complete